MRRRAKYAVIAYSHKTDMPSRGGGTEKGAGVTEIGLSGTGKFYHSHTLTFSGRV